MSDTNDPRILLAAERTLLAWNRTALSLMGFGFFVERFGLFVHMLGLSSAQPLHRDISFWVGAGFIALGLAVAILTIMQFRRVLRSLTPAQIPRGYFIGLAPVTNLLMALLGLALLGYLFYDFP